MTGNLLSTTEIYDFILSEGDLRQLLTRMEALRQQHSKAYCARFHLEPATNGLMLQRNTIEPLTQEMIEELRQKGEIEY